MSRGRITVTLVGAILILAALYGIWLGTTAEETPWQTVPAGAYLFSLNPGILLWIQGHVPDAVWDNVIVTLLEWPAWAVFGLPGAVLLGIAWRERVKSLFKGA